MAALRSGIDKEDEKKRYTSEEVLSLASADLEKTFKVFKAAGFSVRMPEVEIDKDPDLANIFWDGKKIVFGLGIVNSEVFGPYDSAIVAHEACHALFNIRWQGQAGATSESICDVIGVLVADDDWTIGRIRGGQPGSHETIRSLKNPGTAYKNHPLMGTDPQPDHMSKLYTSSGDNGGVHINGGILNKAAYLMSEGGTHGGVTIEHGIGREKLLKLYLETIKKLPPDGDTVDFAGFRDIVINTADSLFSSADDRQAVRQAFAAVGL
jgi:Zn-dependent metalloprotease